MCVVNNIYTNSSTIVSSISITPRKLKAVDIENASYEDVKDAVAESVVEPSAEEPPTTEVTEQPSVVEEAVTVKDAVEM